MDIFEKIWIETNRRAAAVMAKRNKIRLQKRRYKQSGIEPGAWNRIWEEVRREYAPGALLRGFQPRGERPVEQ